MRHGTNPKEVPCNSSACVVRIQYHTSVDKTHESSSKKNWHFFTHSSASYILSARNLDLNNPRLRLDITKDITSTVLCAMLPAQTAVNGGHWAMKLTMALYPKLGPSQGPSYPAHAGKSQVFPQTSIITWECGVSLREHSGKCDHSA